MRILALAMVLAMSATVSTAFAQAVALPECVIEFDSSCPNSGPECGATFTGGLGCWIAGLAFCYDSGARAWQVTQASPVTINFSGDVLGIDVFFAESGSGTTGQMNFFDEQNNPVGSPLTTNENCEFAQNMPSTQSRAFATPVRRIEVTANGSGGFVWMDTLHINPPGVPVELARWGTVKGLFSAP